MADFDDIINPDRDRDAAAASTPTAFDAFLSSSLKGAAVPAASVGVADAIRARVAAGDPGISVGGATAPGWTPPRPPWFVPLLVTIIALAVAVAILGTVLVARGSAPRQTATPTSSASTSTSPRPTVSPTRSSTPSATPTPTPTPTVTPTPFVVPDTTSPTMNVGTWNPNGVYGPGSPCGSTAELSLTATDNVAVSKVTAVSSLAGTSVSQISQTGSTYVFRFTGVAITNQQDSIVTFTAVDAAGNTANGSRPITVYWNCIG